MNILTVCRILGLLITVLKFMDKDGKLEAIVELLQSVDSKLCGSGVFGDGVDSDTQQAAETIAAKLRAACDCDDCEC